MIALDIYPIPSQDVVGRIIKSDPDGSKEAVLVLPTLGQVKVVNEIGSIIWTLADGTRSIGEIAALICEQYDVDLVTAQADTLEFVQNLELKGILKLSLKPKGG